MNACLLLLVFGFFERVSGSSGPDLQIHKFEAHTYIEHDMNITEAVVSYSWTGEPPVVSWPMYEENKKYVIWTQNWAGINNEFYGKSTLQSRNHVGMGGYKFDEFTLQAPDGSISIGLSVLNKLPENIQLSILMDPVELLKIPPKAIEAKIGQNVKLEWQFSYRKTEFMEDVPHDLPEIYLIKMTHVDPDDIFQDPYQILYSTGGHYSNRNPRYNIQFTNTSHDDVDTLYGTLEISNINETDIGAYSLSFRYMASYHTLTILDVESFDPFIPTTEPVITFLPCGQQRLPDDARRVIFQEEDGNCIRCTVLGQEISDVQLYKDGQKLKTNGDNQLFTRHKEFDSTYLDKWYIIKEVKETDAGLYSCKTESMGAVSEKKLEVVIYKPLSINIKHILLGDNQVILTCDTNGTTNPVDVYLLDEEVYNNITYDNWDIRYEYMNKLNLMNDMVAETATNVSSDASTTSIRFQKPKSYFKDKVVICGLNNEYQLIDSVWYGAWYIWDYK